MAEKIVPLAPLRAVLEGEQDPSHNPDVFARLVGVFLEIQGNGPYLVLCKVAFGHPLRGKKSFFDLWAAGLTTPTPLMREKVVRHIRAYHDEVSKKVT